MGCRALLGVPVCTSSADPLGRSWLALSLEWYVTEIPCSLADLGHREVSIGASEALAICESIRLSL